MITLGNKVLFFMTLRILKILSALFLLCVVQSYAQSWVAEFDADKFDEKSGWYFTEDFVVKNKALHLNGNMERSSTIVEKLIALPERVRYKGIVTIGDNNTSVRNNFYVLLSMTNKRSDKARRFVALYFGDVISFLEITHNYVYNPSTKKTEHRLTQSKSRHVGICERYPYPSELIDNKICFDVLHDKKEGWHIRIYTGEFSDNRLLADVKTKEYMNIGERENFVGFAVNYTKDRRTSFSCHYLSISDAADNDGNSGSNPVLPKEDEENGFDERDGQHIVLSEVMAKPEGQAPEYIEIHNPTATKISLNNYYIIYSSGKKNVVVPLSSLGVIYGGEYLVLSSAASKIPYFYANAISENCREIKLPLLSNDGFDIGLGYGDAGITFDDVGYSTDYFPKGYKSKSGMSLQRVDVKKKSTADNWTVCTEESRKATPTRGYLKPSDSHNAGSGSFENDGDGLSENAVFQAYKLMKESRSVDLQVNIYDANGGNILRYVGGDARRFLTDMVVMPQKIFPSLYTYRDGYLLMSLVFKKSKEGYRKFVYKFRVYEN